MYVCSCTIQSEGQKHFTCEVGTFSPVLMPSIVFLNVQTWFEVSSQYQDEGRDAGP